MANVVDIFLRKKALTLPFELNIDKWDTMDEEVKSIVSGEWKSIKFMNAEGSAINEAISTVPDDMGGYMFLFCDQI